MNNSYYYFLPICSLTGVLIGQFIVVPAIDKEEYIKNTVENIVNTSDAYHDENSSNTYELKRTFEPGEHIICLSYFRPIDSITEYKIDIPDGYEIVSNDQNKIKTKNNEYYQIIIKCKNTVTVVANGYYDSKENIVNFLEAGTPVDTMQLKLK